jgi:hypothetical protein
MLARLIEVMRVVALVKAHLELTKVTVPAPALWRL